MRKVWMVAGGVAVAGVAAVVLLATNLGAVIVAAVERVGSDATRAKVTLREADVSLSSGTGALRGLVVGNPEGFSAPCAFELGEVTCTLDTASLTSDTIVVKEVVVEAPQVTFEVGSDLGSNLAAIRRNVEDYGRRFGGADGGGAGTASGGDSAGGGRRFVVESLRIRGGRVRLAATAAGGEVAAAELGEVHLRDLGKGDPITAERLTVIVLDALTREAISAATSKGLAEKAKDLLGGAVEKAGGALKDLLGGKKK